MNHFSKIKLLCNEIPAFLFFCLALGIFFLSNYSLAKASDLIIDNAVCTSNGGRCVLWCITGQNVGICKTGGSTCCASSDEDTKKIQAAYIQTTIKDPDLQQKALNSAGIDTSEAEIPSKSSYNYTLLEKIPGIGSQNLSFAGYLSAVYKLAIWIVGLCALFMFLVGAFMYMLAAANTSKMGSAKEIMQDALIGLLLALTSYLILYVINPDLVNLRLPSVSMPSGGRSGAVAPPPTAGTGSGCGGFGVAGISNAQCNDASQPLSDLLACIHSKYPDTKINSISDSAGFDACKNNWSKPPCAHAKTSCHYGGGAAQTSDSCKKSHAADLSVRGAGGGLDLSIANNIKSAAAACGARVNDETSGPAPHIHVSDQTDCCSL
jgi:hypothetical protein